MPQSSRRAARLLVFALQLATSVAFVSPLSRESGFPLDDAWIHQVVARTFAETGTLGYSPGAHGAGATSYLWALLLGIGHILRAPPVLFTSVLGLAAALVTAQGLLTLTWPDEDDGRAAPLVATAPRVLAVLLACAGGDLTWFAFSGMEASLVCALLVWAIAIAVRREGDARRRAVTAGVLAGLAALTRPDVIPFGLLVACLVAERVPKPARRGVLALALGPWAWACVLYFGSNMVLTGTALPATMRGRRWLWIESAGGGDGTLGLAKDLALAWAYRLRQFTLGLSTNAAFWAALGFAILGVRDAVRARRRGLVALAAFALFHVAIYVAVLPTPGHGGRYQPLVPVLFVLFAVDGVFVTARALAGARPRLARSLDALAGVGVVVLLGNAWWEWRLAHAAAVVHINLVERTAGERVAELPADAKVASFDVGAIGYFSRRRLLDLGALTTPWVMSALVEDRVAELLVREGITHVVLPAGREIDFPDLSNFGFRLHLVDHPSIRLETEATFESDPETWLRGVWYTQNATYRQRLSRVSKTACAAPPLPAGPLAWAVGGIPADARGKVERAYAKAAAHGLCVRFSTEGTAPGCWSIALGPSPSVTGVPEGLRDPARAAKDLALAAKLYAGPHLARGDTGPAALATLHAAAAVVRADVDPCFFAPLPALERARPVGVMPPPEPKDTLLWGMALAAGVVLNGVLAGRARKSS